jgi:hypothetical protein
MILGPFVDNLKRPLRYQWWSTPLALLTLSLAAYGLLIPQLGFYWDDWPVIMMIDTGANFWDFYQFDRPFSAWTYVVTAPILGTNRIIWHVFTLLLWWLTSVGVWLALKQVWPERGRQVTMMAFLFAIYPAFGLQPIAVAFSQHFIAYLLFVFSLSGMLAALRFPRWAWLLTIASLVAAALHSLTMEYFWGLELIRPVLLWVALSRRIPDARQRLLRTFRAWGPYLLVLVGVVFWRAVVVDIPDDPNRLVLLAELLSDPLGTILNLLNIMVKDFVFLFPVSWYRTLQPDLIDFHDRFLLASWGLVTLLSVLSAFFLLRLWPAHAKVSAEKPDTWNRQAFFVGLAALFAGMLSIWTVARQTTVGLYADRFTLPALFGISILLIAMVESVISRHIAKIVLVSLLVGLAAGWHLRNTNDYRWDWTKQQRAFWQLYWRAPGLKSGTAILADGSLFKYVGGYSTATAFNTLYPQQTKSPNLSYWFFEIDSSFRYNMDGLVQGMPIKGSLRNLVFSGFSGDSLVVDYEPDEGNCLWVLGPEDALNKDLPELTLSALPVSNLERIVLAPIKEGDYPLPGTFGAEPEHTWCYYFQKTDLARQIEDWRMIADLGNQAMALGFEPNNPFEWMPFIEGYAHTGGWEQAEALSLKAYEMKKRTALMLCSLWDEFERDLPASPGRDRSRLTVGENLNCATP